jgi:tRNA 2-thiouridine synthesizing protein A
MPEIKVDSNVDICPAELKVNCVGETCPVPLVETRKALRKAKEGDIVEVTGTHPASKKEIPMAVKALGLKLLSVEEAGGVWKIRIQR